MAVNFSIRKLVPEFLSEQRGNRFTARAIAEELLKRHPEACEEKRRKSTATKFPLLTDADLIQQIVAEIGSQRAILEQKDGISTTETRPRQYYFAVESETMEAAAQTIFTQPTKSCIRAQISEADLYPKLSEFALNELSIYSMRIDERKSVNSYGAKGNHWLHPDIVGVQDLSAGWHREIVDCASSYMDKKTKLFSFELKLLINRSNAREVFFQTVSNSSWANFAYLVAAEISGTSTIPELRMLSSIHGIGLIRLNYDDLAESDVVIPARERPGIDWTTASRLTEENSDFRTFIRRIKQFYQTNDIRPQDWDYVQTRN